VFSAAVRTGDANAVSDGVALKQKDLRNLVKQRFAGGAADAWILHCVTLEGMDLRTARPSREASVAIPTILSPAFFPKSVSLLAIHPCGS
jgi:hypothetical protein